MQDLNLLIPPLSGITLTSAVGIDAAGDIVAYGTDASGQIARILAHPGRVTRARAEQSGRHDPRDRRSGDSPGSSIARRG